MSILIKGMEMPKVCIDNGWYGNCPLDRTWCAQRFAPEGSTNGSVHKDQWNKLPSWCPIVPLPEKHGRLIDADKLLKEEQVINRFHVVSACDVIMAPTIVPAEGGTDECSES